MREKLAEVEQFLVNAEKTALRLVDKEHAKVRESMVHAYLPRMTWAAADLMREQRESYIHGDERPLHLTRMTVEVSVVNGTAPLDFDAFQMVKTSLGWWSPVNGVAGVGPFDFEWNFSVGRRQSYYSREKYASSQMLAGAERGQFLEFKTPIVLNTGESIEGVVRPVTIAIALDFLPVAVKLRFDGFRG